MTLQRFHPRNHHTRGPAALDVDDGRDLESALERREADAAAAESAYERSLDTWKDAAAKAAETAERVALFGASVFSGLAGAREEAAAARADAAAERAGRAADNDRSRAEFTAERGRFLDEAAAREAADAQVAYYEEEVASARKLARRLRGVCVEKSKAAAGRARDKTRTAAKRVSDGASRRASSVRDSIKGRLKRTKAPSGYLGGLEK